MSALLPLSLSQTYPTAEALILSTQIPLFPSSDLMLHKWSSPRSPSRNDTLLGGRETRRARRATPGVPTHGSLCSGSRSGPGSCSGPLSPVPEVRSWCRRILLRGADLSQQSPGDSFQGPRRKTCESAHWPSTSCSEVSHSRCS